MLYGYRSLDRRPRVIALEGKILVAESENILHLRIEFHYRQRPRRAGKLLAHLVEMVEVNVGVTGSMDKFSRLQAAYLGYHHRQQGIGSNVERHSEEGVRTSLVQLAGQSAVGYVELEEAMTGRQGHLVHIRRVPRADYHPTRVRIALYRFNDFRKLVYAASVRGIPAAPLLAVNRTEVAVSVCPFVPDAYLVVVKVSYVCIAADEPQQFVYYRAQVHLLGC